MIDGIYVITDEQLAPGRTHVDIARAALEGGASVIQLRDKTSRDEYLIEAGREILKLAARATVPFIVNDRLEVALACGADGLHIGQGDMPASEIRRLIPGKILGVSVATVDEAKRARDDGADYLGVGPIFSTSTKADAGAPISSCHIPLLKAVSGLPVVAIGGINANNLIEVARAGADSAAVISAVVCAEDMVDATRSLVEIWEAGKRS